jgi:predicted transposase YdaD
MSNSYREKFIEEGIATGMAKGIAKGMNEGIATGIAKGEEKKAKQVALTLLKNNIAIELIMETTGFSKETIIQLKKLKK